MIRLLANRVPYLLDFSQLDVSHLDVSQLHVSQLDAWEMSKWERTSGKRLTTKIWYIKLIYFVIEDQLTTIWFATLCMFWSLLYNIKWKQIASLCNKLSYNYNNRETPLLNVKFNQTCNGEKQNFQMGNILYTGNV